MKQTIRLVSRRVVRRLVFPAIEGLWAVTFSLVGRLIGPRAVPVVPRGRDHVLVVAPHPDDETLGCGLAISAHVGAGDMVTVLVVTDGGRSRSHGLSAAQMRLQRCDEALNAITVLGARATLLGLPEGSWSTCEFATSLVRVLDVVHPTILYAPSTIDYHPEHRRVARGLADVLAANGQVTPEIRVYEVQVPLTPALANTYLAGDRQAQLRRRRALLAYTSQRRSFGWMARRDLYNRLMMRTQSATEIYSSMSIAAYASLVDATSRGRFRSLRPWPLTDPLAWIVGLRTRISAARLLSGLRRQN
jgi:LmbE family N-acetylglucosaminyl deacetylase